MRSLSVILHLLLALVVAITSGPSQVTAQYRQLEPMACPTALLDYSVSASTPSGRSYTFINDWKHASNPGSGVTQAFYDPAGSIGLVGYYPTLTSTDQRAEWRYASIYVKCQKIVYYRPNGTIESVTPVFTTLYTEGDVREREITGCCSGCGSGGGGGSGGSGTELTPVGSPDYDPYDPGASLDPAFSLDEEGDCTGGDSGSETDGTQYEPGDHTGGETVDWGTGIGNGGTSVCGDAAMVEFVCIDVYNEETGFWEEWGCGYVTTC